MIIVEQAEQDFPAGRPCDFMGKLIRFIMTDSSLDSDETLLVAGIVAIEDAHFYQAPVQLDDGCAQLLLRFSSINKFLKCRRRVIELGWLQFRAIKSPNDSRAGRYSVSIPEVFKYIDELSPYSRLPFSEEENTFRHSMATGVWLY
jgi:hypothetical protein